MNILFTGIFPIWQCHFIAESNFIEEHLAAGDSIFLTECDAGMETCNANPEHNLIDCLTCMGMRQSAVKKISKPICHLKLIDRGLLNLSYNYPEFQSVKELEGYKLDDANAGYGIVSSLMTNVSDPRLDPRDHKELIEKSLNDYMRIYRTACRHIEQHGIDLVYIYNGRFIPSRAWIDACKKHSIEYVTHERFGMPDRVVKVRNGLLYECDRYKGLIEEFWENNKNDKEVIDNAIDFFEERPKGKNTGWLTFIGKQQSKLLPSTWSKERTNIVIFASTEIEMQGVSEFFDGALYDDQIAAYLEIIQRVKELDEAFHFTIRIHPNSQIETSRWWRSEKFTDNKNVTIIEPESSVSSYDLLAACDKVVVFQSTMGIEATYWGKPAIALSSLCYRGIDAVYEPASKEEALELILDPSLPSKPKSNALPYGAFMRCGCPKLPYSEAINHCKLTFKGKKTNAHASVLKSAWRDRQYFQSPYIPKTLRRVWWRMEWIRLSWLLGGDLSQR